MLRLSATHFVRCLVGLTMDGASNTQVSQLLERLLRRHDVDQAFLFGGEGEPFWAARTPLRADELSLFREALSLIEHVEADRPKPFLAHDSAHRFTVTAMSAESNLYLVVIGTGTEADAALRARRMRDELWPDVRRLKSPVLRLV